MKILSLIALTFVIAACGGGETATPADADTAAGPVDPARIDDVLEGYVERDDAGRTRVAATRDDRDPIGPAVRPARAHLGVVHAQPGRQLHPPASQAEASGAVGEFFWDGAANTLFRVDPGNDLTAVLFLFYRPFGKIEIQKDFRDAIYYRDPVASALIKPPAGPGARRLSD